MGRPSLFFILESMRTTLTELAGSSFRADRFNQMLKWLGLIEERLEQLEAENEQLKTRVREQTAAAGDKPGTAPAGEPAQNERFTTLEGVLWKRGPHGYESVPYCPRCRTALSFFPARDPDVIRCGSCKFQPPFGPSDLKAIRKLLPGGA